MRELADALGVKRPTLYFYFPDLGSVFESVLDQTYQQLAEVVLARVRAQSHPLDRLRAVVEATIDFHRERPQLIGGLLQLWSVAGRDFASVLARERQIGETSRAALIADVLVHQVLGIARPDGVTEELADRIIDPLRPKKRKARKKS
jgi:AcrR family transcriptional regulator